MSDIAVNKVVDAIVSSVIYPQDNMTLFAAQKLAKKIRSKARSIGVKSVIAIADKAGHPILVEADDDSYIASYDVAVNKSFTVVSLKMSTKELSSLAKPDGSLYGIQFTNGGKIVIFGGGEPLKNKEGKIIGGLGVSGGSEEQDTELARFGKEVFEKGNN